MPQLSYDKVTSRPVRTEEINYGILYGNEKIVFIKVGADGSIRGYQDKYLKMAHRIHKSLGATVICASNPEVEYDVQAVADKAMISKVAADCGFTDYEVYFVGTSDGGYQNLLLAKEIPQTVKILGINPSLSSVQDFVEKVQALPHVQKIMVYGTRDDVYDECVPALQGLECENLEILTVEGADHEFTDMVDAFIALIDLI
jgi:alpha/beta superfamily hydrolase